ncbi:undecaprenyl-phosphate glucose phosphotransferase [Mucilaginibacter koreensis]
MPYRYSKYLPGFTFLCDIILLNIALYNPIYIALNNYNISSAGPQFILLVNVVWVVLAPIANTYKIPRPLQLKNYLNKFFQNILYHLLIVFSCIYFLDIYRIPAEKLFITYTIFILLVIFQRLCLSLFLDYIRRNGYNARNIIILGEENIAARLAEHFVNHREYGYDLIDTSLGDNCASLSEEDLTEQLLAKKPYEIFICYKNMDESLLNFLVQFGETYKVKIKVVSDLMLTHTFAAKLINYDNLPVLQLQSNHAVDRKIRLLKRGFDVAFSSTLMMAGAPVFAGLWLITKVTSKGPAFYTQERVGLNGKPFKIIKFRSMYVDAEKAGPQLARDGDPRITKWGKVMRKTRLDELPQFWNVLRGDMSIVGPRPERRHFIEQITEKSPNYKHLLKIKPGITSIGQVQYGYAENVDQMCDRMHYDLQYLQNITLNSDLNIIFKTVKVMIQGKGK